MTRSTLMRRWGARLAPVPWLSLSFLLTGCPLSDHYSLGSNGAGGGGNDFGGNAGFGGSSEGGLGGGGGSDAGSANGGAQTAGNGGSSGGSGQAGALESGGEAGQAPSGGNAGLGGGSGIGGSNLSSGGGSSGTAGASGSVGAAGTSGAGGACSVASCSNTCCPEVTGSSALICADTTRDFQNCGACGTICNAGRSCTASACSSDWVPMSTPPVGFTARWRAASVAMGKSVFIWGGSDSSGAVLDSGAIYSPVSDTWTALTKDAQTPTARVFATAVWTGSVVIVVGGSDASGGTVYKDGAVYDPVAASWATIPMASKARSSALGVWDGTHAVLWGGIGATGAAVSGADIFDLTAWSAASSAGDPGAALAPASGWDGDSGTLYLEGGLVAAARSAQVSSYASGSDTWTSLSNASAPAARSNAFGVWDGAVFAVWGGRDDSSAATALHSDGKYRYGANWITITATGAPSARMAVPRRHGWSFSTGFATIALLGGQTSLAGAGAFTTTGATCDLKNAKWGTVAAWPSGEQHDYGVGVWTGDEFVLWGGRSTATGSATLTGERWKP